MEISEATEVFVNGFSRVRSRTYPYVPTWRDGLWVMQDHPPRKNSRKVEVVAYGVSPKEVVEKVVPLNLGRYCISHIHTTEEFESVREQYKALGYRALSTEWMFIHRLAAIPELTCEPSVREIQTAEELSTIKFVAGQPRKFEQGTRLFGVWNEERDFGWVRSIPIGESAWVSALHVYEDSRGKGYGGALMSSLLQRDRDCGIKTSVLLGTAAGSRLYPHLGYEQIATLQIFCPKRGG